MECSLALCLRQIGAVWALTLSARSRGLPDLQLDDSHYELKGIRVDSSRTNCNSGVRSTGFSTGVAKKELSTAPLT
jgi:hypothetical protein